MFTQGYQDDDQPSDRACIELLLSEQVAAWNRGDLKTFLNSYSRSKDLTFTCAGVVRRGFESTQRRYYEEYGKPSADGPTTGQKMGKLELLTAEVSATSVNSLQLCDMHFASICTRPVHI
jgi:hypothetical protein